MNQNCGRKPYGEVRRLPAHGRHKNDKREVLTVDVERMLAEDARFKRQCRGGLAVGKKRPGSLIMPSSLTGRSPPYSWRDSPPLVKVSIVTGEILIFRWPLE
jgi:hypothetical protein